MNIHDGSNEIIKNIEDGINRLRYIVNDILRRLEGLEISAINNNEEAFPQGLPPFTRSVSWLVEKALIQNLIKYRTNYRIQRVSLPPSELAQYDCIIKLTNNPLKFYINVKTSEINARDRYDDISKAERLISLLTRIGENPLLIVTVKIEFVHNGIKFHPDKTIIFNVAWLEDFKYNPSNRNLQTRTLYAEKLIKKRLNSEFILILKQKITKHKK